MVALPNLFQSHHKERQQRLHLIFIGVIRHQKVKILCLKDTKKELQVDNVSGQNKVVVDLTHTGDLSQVGHQFSIKMCVTNFSMKNHVQDHIADLYTVSPVHFGHIRLTSTDMVNLETGDILEVIVLIGGMTFHVIILPHRNKISM